MKMKIIVTAGELWDNGMWTEACDELDIDYYALINGQMDPEYELAFTRKQAKAVGLIYDDDDELGQRGGGE